MRFDTSEQQGDLRHERALFAPALLGILMAWGCVLSDDAPSLEGITQLPPVSAAQERRPRPVARSAVQVREYVVIDDAAASARVLADPSQERTLGRIAAGTKVRILGKRDVKSGMLTVTYYRILFDGQEGWVSQYVTSGPQPSPLR